MSQFYILGLLAYARLIDPTDVDILPIPSLLYVWAPWSQESVDLLENLKNETVSIIPVNYDDFGFVSSGFSVSRIPCVLHVTVHGTEYYPFKHITQASLSRWLNGLADWTPTIVDSYENVTEECLLLGGAADESERHTFRAEARKAALDDPSRCYLEVPSAPFNRRIWEGHLKDGNLKEGLLREGHFTKRHILYPSTEIGLIYQVLDSEDPILVSSTDAHVQTSQKLDAHYLICDTASRLPVCAIPGTWFFPRGVRPPQVKYQVHDQFLASYASGTAVPYLRSAMIPMSQNRVVYEIVGSTFSKIVNTPGAHVLVLIYDPRGAHSLRVDPVLSDVAFQFEREDLIYGRIDSSINDIPTYVPGNPTLLLYKADHKVPIRYEGGYSTSDLLAWMHAMLQEEEGNVCKMRAFL